jgi:hypothetical protein
MGYYSTVDAGSFLSKKSAEDCEAIRKRILADKVSVFGNLGMIEEARFTEHNHDDLVKGLHTIYVEFDDYKAKWYDDCERALALLMSVLIDEKDSTDLTMSGEDGNMWGWRIRHMRIIAIQVEWIEVGEARHLTKESLVEALL